MSELRPHVNDALSRVVKYDRAYAAFNLSETPRTFNVLRDELHRRTAELEQVKAERDGLREAIEKCRHIRMSYNDCEFYAMGIEHAGTRFALVPLDENGTVETPHD